jgi:tRNA A-37 threonylcarbamoyl transferase component Bud32
MFVSHVYTWAKLLSYISGLYLWYGRTPIFYKKTLQLLRNENILFTKIFQSLANSSNFHASPELKHQFQLYAANTSYSDSEIDYECLDKIEQDYTLQLDRRVINSGMIALVFKGYDASGTPIIIKLKRKNITQHLQKGCDSIALFYNYAAWYAPQNIYVRILKPFITNISDIVEQCNFTQEIANMKRAKEDYEPLTFIQIPTVYNKSPAETEYIVMECIEGTHVLPPNTSEEVRLDYMEKFGTFTTYGFLYNAIQHTDLHSGNILFTPTGLGVIDFGMTIQVSDEIHDILLAVGEIIKNQPPLHEIDFIDTFKELFAPPLIKADIKNPQKVEDIIISIAQPLIEAIEFDELNITDNLSVLSEHLGREIVLNRDVYKILLGLSMMTGKVTILGPHYPNAKLMDIERRALRNAYALIMK